MPQGKASKGGNPYKKKAGSKRKWFKNQIYSFKLYWRRERIRVKGWILNKRSMADGKIKPFQTLSFS